MTGDPRIRASDDDRDRTASLLREHHAAGRLDPEEFNERLDKTFSAKTIGDLEELLSDLPSIDLYRLPGHGLSRRGQMPGSSAPLAAMPAADGVSGRHGRFSPVWQAAWGSWISISAVLVVIWALSGMGYPWFAWIVGPWGVLMFGRWISGAHPGGAGGAGGAGGPNQGHGHDRHHQPGRPGELPGDHLRNDPPR